MDGTLQAIVDQTSKLGGGMERLNGMSLELGQAWAKQKLQGEEILQLVERGVPVWELLEKVTGKNTQELQKLSSAGKLGRDTIKLLIEEIGKGSAGAAAANMSLLSGLMANMADRWTEFKGSVAQAGWLDYVKGQLSAFGDQLDQMASNGKAGEKAFAATAEAAEKTTEAAEKAGDAGAEAGTKQAGAAQSVMQKAGGLAGFYNNLTMQLNSMSKSAENAFHAMQRGSDGLNTETAQGELNELQGRLKEVREEIGHMQAFHVSSDPTGIGDWMKETAKNAASAKERFLEQKIALEELLEGYEKGVVSAQRMASASNTVNAEIDLLNEQDLDRLNSAIDQAESSMRSLSDSTRSTLEGLQDELDRLQGNTEKVQQRQFESRQRQLKQQLEQAQQQGDGDAISNLQQALSVNQQVNTEKQKQLQQKQRETFRQQQQKEKPRITQPRQPAQSKSHDKVIRLEYLGGSVNVGVDGSDETKLLEALKNAGMRSV